MAGGAFLGDANGLHLHRRGHLGEGVGQSLLGCTQKSHAPHCAEVKCVSCSV